MPIPKEQALPLVGVKPNYGSSHAVNMGEELMTDPFGENYQQDTEFWKKVSTCFRANKEQIKWFDIEMKLRLERLVKIYEGQSKDPLVELVTTAYDRFDHFVKQHGNEEIKDSFVKQLTEFATIMLREDYNGYASFPIDGDSMKHDECKESNKSRENTDRHYASLITTEHFDGKTSILHLAAQRNLTEVAKVYLSYYPGYVCREDTPNEDTSSEPARMAVEWALEENYEHDDVCCFLMKSTLNERVRRLFEGNEKTPADYSLLDLINKGTMKKTVNAVLDSCVNPNFPFIVQDPEQKDNEEEAWSKMSTLPLRYHFYFQILDGDNEGKPAKIFDSAEKFQRDNDKFNSLGVSALQLIADHADSENDTDSIRHPTVRQLVRLKWESYGKKVAVFQTVFYLFFLLVLSFALGMGAKLEKPSEYNDSTDRFRGFCEVMSLMFAVIYILLEVEQFIRSPKSYAQDWAFNLLDLGGLIAIVAIVPCRYAEALTVTRSISVIAFFINFLRVFQYFLVYDNYGIYVKTFAVIILKDITKFAAIFSIVWMAFSGSVYLAMSASNGFNGDFSNFWHIFLQELRAMTEGKEFADSYADYNPLFTLFIMLNMFIVIIILSNILIGQVSYRYEKAQEQATVQFDIDKTKMLCSIDRSFIFHKLRMKYYRKGLFVSDQDLIKDLLMDWNQFQKQEDTENAINEMLKKRILKQR